MTLSKLKHMDYVNPTIHHNYMIVVLVASSADAPPLTCVRKEPPTIYLEREINGCGDKLACMQWGIAKTRITDPVLSGFLKDFPRFIEELKDSDLLAMGEKARVHARENFSWARFGDSVSRYLKTLRDRFDGTV